MKEFVLCLCLLFSQYPKSEMTSNLIDVTGIERDSSFTLIFVSGETIQTTKNVFLEEFGKLEDEIEANSFRDFSSFDYFFYETVVHLKKESYKNPDPDYYSEHTHSIIPRCKEHNDEACVISNENKTHSTLDPDLGDSLKSEIEEMVKEEKNLIPIFYYYTLEKRGDEFVIYPLNPFVYTFYQKKKDFIENLKKF